MLEILKFKDINSIFSIQSETEFNELALNIFHYQANNCKVYNEYLRFLNVNIESINHYSKIPFLPIEFFKSHKILTNYSQEKIIFSSSGTTGLKTSKHYVCDISMYETSYLKGFDAFYGNIEEYCILGLLPSYLEREGSSLIYMVNDLIKKSKHEKSGFYLNDYKKLYDTLLKLESTNQKVLLIGVSFALLEFTENYQLNLKNTIVMETGGMKGKRKELTRKELHSNLSNGFGVSSIHSEYGMTELLSQAYSKGDGVFETPPWMKILIREVNDPFSLQNNKTGGINVIDLANLYSCSFIETKDLGKKIAENKFEILGRFDNSDVRGCNLLIY